MGHVPWCAHHVASHHDATHHSASYNAAPPHRYDVKLDEIEKIITNILPSRLFGHLILTTPYGIMDHEEARRKHTGGKVLGFFF